jgi:hypothetical protein
MMKRGIFEFDVTDSGDLVDSDDNTERLRRLWLDRAMIDGQDLGPGNAGDFDYGAWHVACHLVGAGGVRRGSDGRLLWLEISHEARADEYYASVTEAAAGGVETHRLDSAEGRRLLAGSEPLGFVEGNSVGRISARSVRDSADRFNGWRRQDFDQPITSGGNGGKVWEHWCTVRDVRASDPIASSVLRAYVSLAAALGDRFVPAVTRGRRSYGHPQQLCAMVRAGLTSEASATWETSPVEIPAGAERKFLEATPGDALAAATTLSWQDPPQYHMFKRRIASWSRAANVRADLRTFVAARI